MNYRLYGFEVRLSDFLTETVWVFPKDRFIEYEPKDEGWCRRFGFGHEETRPKADAYQVGSILYFHPETFRRFLNESGAIVEQGSVIVPRFEQWRQEAQRKIEQKIFELPPPLPVQAQDWSYVATTPPALNNWSELMDKVADLSNRFESKRFKLGLRPAWDLGGMMVSDPMPYPSGEHLPAYKVEGLYAYEPSRSVLVNTVS